MTTSAHKDYVNTNNIHNLPNTIHHHVYTPEQVKTTCNAAVATPNNSTSVIAKVTCKRCLVKLGKASAPVEPVFEEALEAFTPDEEVETPAPSVQKPTETKGNTSAGASDDSPKTYTEQQLDHVASLIKAGKVEVPKSTSKKTKPANIHLFLERDADDLQKNGKPRPNTMCSIPGNFTTNHDDVTCKVCLSVMAKNAKAGN